MPALFTQTLDGKLKILLVADPTQLAKLVVKNIQNLNKINITLLSWEDLSEKQSLLEKDWYKICLLIEHPFERKNLLKLSPALLDRSICIMPLTSAVKGDSEQALGWASQIDSEKILFNNLIKNIDISRFIFYKDLVKKSLNPALFLFNQLDQQLWLDPGVELKLQSHHALAERLTILLLRPQRKAKVIGGKPRLSGVYVQKIRDIYDKHYQLRFPIKQISLSSIDHPVLKAIGSDLELETTTESSKEIVSLMAHFNKFPKNKLKEGVGEVVAIGAGVLMSRPKKTELVKIWNQIKKTTQVGRVEQTTQGVGAINTLFSRYRQHQKEDHLDQMTKKTRLGFRKLKHHKFLFLGGVGVSVMALGALILMTVFFTNVSRIQSLFLTYLSSRSLPITAQEKKMAELKQSSDLIANQLGFINPLFPSRIFSQAQQIVEASQLLEAFTKQELQFQQTMALSYREIMDQAEGDSFLALKKSTQDAEQFFKTISLLQGELKNYSTDKLRLEEKQLIEEYQQYLATQEKFLSQHQQLSALFPTLLGQGQKQIYAIVLQNNQELRPTGGFIQAVALLTFNEGKLINIQVEDVYDLDQRLKGVMEPPEGVRQFLGEERWFLRDSNWSPDFPQVAEKIRWFIDKSLGINVDGVVGINNKVFEEILAVIEQLDVNEHNEVLTKRNLGERMEFHSEVQLINTATNRDYAELILLELINKLKTLPEEKVIPLLSSLVKMANYKELLITVFEPSLQSSFESLGWSGSLIQPNCPAVFGETSCVVDMVAQVEANVGVNKANYYLDRQIDHNITLLPDRAVHKRVVSFKNKAQANAWPKGPYKAYSRFYLPLNAELKSIKINDLELADEQIIKSVELERQVVGVLTETAVKAETRLQLEYSLPYQEQTPFTYVFFDQKQPGARETSPRVFLQYAPDLSPTLIAPQAEVQGDVIIFNPSKDIGHMFVGVTFE